MRYYLSLPERTSILSKLTEEQKTFLLEELKRSKKTAFANVLAKKKAKVNNSNREVIEQIQSWQLLEYIDGGEVTDKLRCECGRKLRYQYIVVNTKTKETRKFGINHLEEHTGIPVEIAREIVKGLSEVDYEMDELLIKIRSDWSLKKAGIEFPHGYVIPEDVRKHIDLKLPLFDSQISKVLQAISDLEKIRKRVSPSTKRGSKSNLSDLNQNYDDLLKSLKPLEFEYSFDKLTKKQQQIIVLIIDNSEGEISSRELCELLIKHNVINESRLKSGKPAMFPYISMYLDFLASRGKISLLKKDLDDRIYKLIHN